MSRKMTPKCKRRFRHESNRVSGGWSYCNADTLQEAQERFESQGLDGRECFIQEWKDDSGNPYGKAATWNWVQRRT